jgi:hypothetical protein
MTYNIEDVRTADLRRADHPRLQRAAARVQHLAPDVLLVNEMTYDQPGDPGYRDGDPKGQNARRFAENYLSMSQADSLDGLSYQPVMLPVNTGLHSGLDLNNDGRVVSTVPDVPGTGDDGSVPPQTDAGRAYGNDAWGFGTFPGQYGMALLIRDDLRVLRDSMRTFRLLQWHEKPNASVPLDTTTLDPWYNPDERAKMRLSSKSHWDVPVQLRNGVVLHVLANHPTPPGFDGVARRNNHRNHDEIQLWVDYLNRAPYIGDDSAGRRAPRGRRVRRYGQSERRSGRSVELPGRHPVPHRPRAHQQRCSAQGVSVPAGGLSRPRSRRHGSVGDPGGLRLSVRQPHGGRFWDLAP